MVRVQTVKIANSEKARHVGVRIAVHRLLSFCVLKNYNKLCRSTEELGIEFHKEVNRHYSSDNTSKAKLSIL